jgi:hypothetical protein
MKKFIKILKIYTLLMVALCSLPVQATEPVGNKPSIAILVPSCDKYSDLWDPFLRLLFKYWPELKTQHKDMNIYLVSNVEHIHHPRVSNILIPKDRNWSDSMLYALQQIDEPYVLVMLEDYFLNHPVNDQHIWDAFAEMLRQDAAYLQIAFHIDDPDLSVTYPHNIVRKQQNAKYRTSLQAAIWDKKVLEDLLLSGESPWKFEKAGSVRSEAITRPFLAILSPPPIEYLNAVNLGIIEGSVIEYLKNHEDIDLSKDKLKLVRSDSLRRKAWKHRVLIGVTTSLSVIVLGAMLIRTRRSYKKGMAVLPKARFFVTEN